MTLAEIRKRLAWSQREFAEYLGIPLRTLQNWEQGTRKPPEYITKLIYRVLIAEGVLNE